jgi:acyl-coenzyme A synthetase/AMP-(fatty) acid ligase
MQRSIPNESKTRPSGTQQNADRKALGDRSGDHRSNVVIIGPKAVGYARDLGIVSGTGNVRNLGRSGQSIRSRDGDAIPPMDVEDAVQSVAAVREAAVVQSQDDPPGVVCACVSLVDPRTDETSFANEIGAAVSLRFNESLRVTRVVVFDELPKTAGTAKINRRRAAEILQTGTPVPVATIVLSDSIPKPV